MSQATKQWILGLLLAGMLLFTAAQGTKGGLPGVWARITGQPPVLGAEDAEALRRYGFRLSEVAHKSGLDFVHESPTLDSKLAHIMPIIASMGAGASVIDFDGDGWLDVYVVTSKEGGRNALFRNLGNGAFEDVAPVFGVADLNQPGTGVSMGAIWADIDNDGYPDLLVYKWGRLDLFLNRRGQGFDRITESAGLPTWVNANAACWLDYDRDGRIDLFLAGYWPEDLDLWRLDSTKIMCESFEYAKNGGRKYLLRNRGDGTFEDVTEAVGIKSTRWTLGVAAVDLCGSGYPDLFLANDYGVSELYANRGGERFEEVGYETGIGVAPKSGMSISFGDILNQGNLAAYVSNITEPANLVQGNNLWVPVEQTGRGLPRYLNQAAALNVEQGGWSWGARFGDLNNDGHVDLYLTNGYISADKRQSYWYDYGKIAGGLKGLIGDASLWPPIGRQSLAGRQSKCLWLNKGQDFIDVAAAVGVSDVYDGRAVAMADLGNRGALDIIVANQNGPLLLYQNTVATERDWIELELTGGARPDAEKGLSNRSAIGALVRLYWTQGGSAVVHQQLQAVMGGDGYASQSMLRLHFGLGTGAHVEKAVIQWPSGTTQEVVAPEVRVCHKIEEPTP